MPTIKDIMPESVFTIALNTGIQGRQGLRGEPGIQGEKGETGKSGVYVGNEAPTDDSNVWIDLDEEPEEYATKQYVNEMLGVIENGSY